MQRHAPSDVAAIGFGVARRRGAFVAWRLKPRLGGRSPPARADEAAPAAFARPPSRALQRHGVRVDGNAQGITKAHC
jgi:hypothetical protein